MEYRDVVRDFAKRTRYNLEYLRTRQLEQPEATVYEFTQLINSMLGLLVFPQQHFFDSIPRTPIAELQQSGWPLPQPLRGYRQVSDLHKLIRYMRNAITHYNLIFLIDKNQQLSGVEIWNKLEDGTTNWKAKMSTQDIDRFLAKFIDLIDKD